ncbi:MAG: aldo/keto reductase [Actinobacteria bacterium]|nr:aldo/keto reductase [Actinomycetota bacterium]MBU4219807.1 aldo/keto reductase [Actinomycetota bacterium]MBU4358537.1 aldo/keto reductase [Actinomycetota bacterium]MBU4441175.1 aldo/keto reductase [Actinomycetota bacterium]MCG2817426.1 aldo/keto reductase [Actinomycetes bacterium]
MNNYSSASIRRRRLGRTDIEITPIGLGTWQFAEGKGVDRFMYKGLDPEVTQEIVKTVIDGGINWFDTAEGYGWGRSERALSSALSAAGIADEDIVVATKWFPLFRTAESIRKTIDKRKRCLEGYTIGLHQVHNPTSLSSVEAQMDAMADLVDSSQIRSVGVSNFSTRRMRRAHAALERRGLPLASNQVKVSLLDRHIEKNGVLEAAKELGMTIIAWSPLEMGVLTGKFHKDPGLLKSRPIGRRFYLRRQLKRSAHIIEALEEIASAHGVTPAVVALSWLVNFYGETVVAISGATKVNHAEQNVMAMELELSKREMEHLDELSHKFNRLIPFGS